MVLAATTNMTAIHVYKHQVQIRESYVFICTYLQVHHNLHLNRCHGN
jgi:hypothetical protein